MVAAHARHPLAAGGHELVGRTGPAPQVLELERELGLPEVCQPHAYDHLVECDEFGEVVAVAVHGHEAEVVGEGGHDVGGVVA